MYRDDKKLTYYTVLCLGIASFVFLVDLYLPLGVAGAVLYVVVVLIALAQRKRNFVLQIALLCTALTMIGFLFSPPGGELWKVLSNRFLAIFVIWASAILGLSRLRVVNALTQSEERFRTAFENTPVGMVLINAEGDFLQVNHACCETFGYTADELIGENVTIFIPERYRAKHNEGINRLVSGAPSKMLGESVELEGLRKDGTEFPIELRIEQFCKTVGVYRFVGAIRDITEIKRNEQSIKESLKEKEILLKEIHHRVKNNLQVITSILSLQSSFIKDEEMKAVFAESQGRIRSMAMIHERLYQSKDLASIDLPEYVRGLVAAISRSYPTGGKPVRFNVEIADIELDIDKCVGLGLIINELCSNAFKYAFPLGKGGEIVIKFVKDNSGNCILTVRDDGIGLADDFTVMGSDSMGFQLVDSLCIQMGGTVEAQSSGGASFRLSFPCNK